MFNAKRTEIILVIFLILFISGFFLIQNPSFIAKLFLIDTRATTQSLSVSLTITGCSEESVNATITGQANFTDICNVDTIQRIEGLDPELNVKVRVYTKDVLPQGFEAPASTLVKTILKYINITVNDSITNPSTIFFNISQSNLGSINPDDIRMYRYDSSWVELDTYVLDGISDPAEFNATTTKFSNFLIGEKAAGLPSITTPLVSEGGISSGAGNFEKEEEKLEKRPKPAVSLPKKITEIAKKIIKKVVEIPRDLIKYKINYKIVYITAGFLLMLVVILELFYYLKPELEK